MNDYIGYGTGARLTFDSRNADFPVAAALDLSQAPVSRSWVQNLDRDNQGSDPECVGASLAQELNADPVPVVITHPWTRKNIYNLAQKLDEWPGEGYAGTSLLGGLKALQQYGAVTEYRWASSVSDIDLALSQIGPVVMAGPWLTGMFTPDGEGHVRVNGTAGNIGHCYMLGELDVARDRRYIEQTWGPNWSVLGWRGWLSGSDVQLLLSMGTQAAIITGRADPWRNPPAPTNHVSVVGKTDGTNIRIENTRSITVDNRQVWP